MTALEKIIRDIIQAYEILQYNEKAYKADKVVFFKRRSKLKKRKKRKYKKISEEKNENINKYNWTCPIKDLLQRSK